MFKNSQIVKKFLKMVLDIVTYQKETLIPWCKIDAFVCGEIVIKPFIILKCGVQGSDIDISCSEEIKDTILK